MLIAIETVSYNAVQCIPIFVQGLLPRTPRPIHVNSIGIDSTQATRSNHTQRTLWTSLRVPDFGWTWFAGSCNILSLLLCEVGGRGTSLSLPCWTYVWVYIHSDFHICVYTYPCADIWLPIRQWCWPRLYSKTVLGKLHIKNHTLEPEAAPRCPSIAFWPGRLGARRGGGWAFQLTTPPAFHHTPIVRMIQCKLLPLNACVHTEP